MLSQPAAARLMATTALPFAVSATATSLTLAAPAKINLFLEILSKRSDGFHAIETLLLTVNLFDTLEFRASTLAGPISLICEPDTIPSDSRNLVWRAAEALRNARSVTFGAEMRLQKRIPHEAGLGGGSSDAASTLLALNQLWKLNCTLGELQEIAGTIGSDIGAFLTPPAGWCTGRGEIVEAESPASTLDLVVVKPPVGLSTAEVYKRVVVPANPVSGEATREALRNGNSIAIAKTLHNRLQGPAFAASPMVHEVYKQLKACQPLEVLLSGSGSCVFALCENTADANRVADQFRRQGPPCQIFVVQSIGPMASSIDLPQ